MNRQNRFVVLLPMMVVLALLAACGTPAPAATTTATSEPPEASAGITVTFDGDKCAFHDPERLPAGQIPIVLDVRDQTAHESYGVQALTMDKGHTLEELVPYQQEISFPLWAHDHGFIEAAQGTTEEKMIVLFEGPLFLTCFTNTADKSQAEYVGLLGPIEIEPVSAFPKGVFTAMDSDWLLTFEDDDSFTFSQNGARVTSGTISIQDYELTWETDSYCGQAMKATYTWTFEDGTLLLQVKGNDPCESRLTVLDDIPYHKQG